MTPAFQRSFAMAFLLGFACPFTMAQHWQGVY
jgi:hypothetical protein